MNRSPLEIEAAFAKDGLNPMFGRWAQSFAFPPVPHRGPNGAARQAFRDQVRAALTNRFLFWGEIQVTITLYLDVQNVLETSETADVDNYAKALLDVLKGPDGLFIDDTQVQTLTVSWIDAAETSFGVEVRGSPDDFMIKPIRLFEMPDGLFYPQPTAVWDVAGPKAASDLDTQLGLSALEMMTAGKRRIRHLLRQAGADRLSASRASAPFETQVRGFHRSRVVDAGFELTALGAWRQARTAWAAGDPDKAQWLKNLADEHKAIIDKLGEGEG